MLGDLAPARLGIDSECLGVALVELGDSLRGVVERQVTAVEVGVEPVEVDLPPRRIVCDQRRVLEDVREGDDAALAVRLELEREAFAAPRPGEKARLLHGDDLPGLVHAPELSADLGAPLHGRDEPRAELLWIGHRPPDALDRMVEMGLQDERGAAVDGLLASVHHGFSSRCRSSAASRSDQYAR